MIKIEGLSKFFPYGRGGNDRVERRVDGSEGW